MFVAHAQTARMYICYKPPVDDEPVHRPRDSGTAMFMRNPTLRINGSIMQCPGIGPTVYSTFACDVKPLDILNYLIKYADDSIMSSEVHNNGEEEIAHVTNWAFVNKMTVNLKTVEILFTDQIWVKTCYRLSRSVPET